MDIKYTLGQIFLQYYLIWKIIKFIIYLTLQSMSQKDYLKKNLYE